MSAAPAATASASRVPEELCAHAELRDARSLSWATCRDCGAIVDVRATPTVSADEAQTQADRAEEAGGEYARQWVHDDVKEIGATLAFALTRKDGPVKDETIRQALAEIDRLAEKLEPT